MTAESRRQKAEVAALRALRSALLLLALPLFAQQPPPPPEEPKPHDISKVDPAPLGGAIATPLPESEKRKLRKYNIEELAGSRQAIGSQLIDGRLPLPLLDYFIHTGKLNQRLSFFEGGLVVVRMSGAGGTIQKRVIIPAGAMKKYLEAASPEKVARIDKAELTSARDDRGALLRVYTKQLTYVERTFDPVGGRSKQLHDAVTPLEDLLRAISEDRAVTSTLPNYEPQVGDELVADDRKTWKVERIIKDGEIIQLRCTSQPTVMYVAKKDLYNYFVGRAGN
ncbi:MAG TPA: hypothetical protein VF980_06385 [Thermoanaerobaculia bacterium]